MSNLTTKTPIKVETNGHSPKGSTEVDKPAKPSSFRVSPRNINNFRRFKASRIVRELSNFFGIHPKQVAKILMAGGVPSAFNTRREVHRLEIELQKRLSEAYGAINMRVVKRPRAKAIPQEVKQYYRHLGRIDALKEIRMQVGALTKADGYAVPANDRAFALLLRVSATSLKKI